MQQVPKAKYQVGDRVYSQVHHQVQTVLFAKWKPADKQWIASWMYRLSDAPGVWLYESTLLPVERVAS